MNDPHRPREYKIAFVTDRSFGEKLFVLAQNRHVWIVESPENAPAINALRSQASFVTSDSDVTWFRAKDDESAEATCLNWIDDVNAHHDEDGWTEITVIGPSLTESIAEAYRAIGVQTFEVTGDGFICRR